MRHEQGRRPSPAHRRARLGAADHRTGAAAAAAAIAARAGRRAGRGHACGRRTVMAAHAAPAGSIAAGRCAAGGDLLADGRHAWPRHRLRPAGGNAGDQTRRTAHPARRPQPARLRPVRPIRRLPARPRPHLPAAGSGRRHRRPAHPATTGRRRHPQHSAAATGATARGRSADAGRTATGTGGILAGAAPAHAAVGHPRARGGDAGPVRHHAAGAMAGPDGR